MEINLIFLTVIQSGMSIMVNVNVNFCGIKFIVAVQNDHVYYNVLTDPLIMGLMVGSENRYFLRLYYGINFQVREITHESVFDEHDMHAIKANGLVAVINMIPSRELMNGI